MAKNLPTTGLTFSFWAILYDKVTSFIGYGKAFREETIRLINHYTHPVRVLDVGCGTGMLVIEAGRRLPTGTQIVGIDPVAEMLVVARQNLREINNSNVRSSIQFRLGVIENIPYPNDYFDLVLCTMTTHHLNRRLKYQGFKEIRRILKPGGVFLNVDFGVPTHVAEKGAISFIKFVIFLYFNVLETLSSNFMDTVRDHFNGILPSLLEKVGFTPVNYLQSRFKRAIFLHAIKKGA